MLNGLLVMSSHRGAGFQQAVTSAAVEWTIAESCESARRWLTKHPSPAVVVSDSTLCDGNWYCVLERLLNIGSESPLLVTAPEGPDVSTILEHGVAGVVRRPFDHRAAALLEAVLRRRPEAERRREPGKVGKSPKRSGTE